MRGYIVDPPQSVCGGQQMVVQRAFFAATLPETPDDLYSRCMKGTLERQRQRVTMRPYTQLSTNTFFGRFPASYWQRWTHVAQVEFRVIVSGTGGISIRASDSAGDARTVAT